MTEESGDRMEVAHTILRTQVDGIRNLIRQRYDLLEEWKNRVYETALEISDDTKIRFAREMTWHEAKRVEVDDALRDIEVKDNYAERLEPYGLDTLEAVKLAAVSLYGRDAVTAPDKESENALEKFINEEIPALEEQVRKEALRRHEHIPYNADFLAKRAYNELVDMAVNYARLCYAQRHAGEQPEIVRTAADNNRIDIHTTVKVQLQKLFGTVATAIIDKFEENFNTSTIEVGDYIITTIKDDQQVIKSTGLELKETKSFETVEVNPSHKNERNAEEVKIYRVVDGKIGLHTKFVSGPLVQGDLFDTYYNVPEEANKDIQPNLEGVVKMWDLPNEEDNTNALSRP